MNDKDRELIIQALHDVGKVGETGFNALVRWQFIDGLTVCLTSSAAVALALWALWRLLKWKPEGRYDDDMARFVRGAGMVVCLVAAALTICSGVQAGLRDMLAPEGAAVAWITAHR